jgi:hypothetical protein
MNAKQMYSMGKTTRPNDLRPVMRNEAGDSQ